MRLSHLVVLLLVILSWGLNFIAIKTGLGGFPPFFLCFLRMFFTAVPAVFFIKAPHVPLRWMILYGLFMFALPFSFLFLSLKTGFAAGLASLVMQMQTFFTILLAIFFLRERLNGLQIGGMILAFSGVGIAGMHIQGASTLSGFFMLLAAAFFWGLGNVTTKKMGPVNALSLLVWSSLLTLPFLLLCSLLFEGSDLILTSIKNLSSRSLISLSYIVYISTLFGYGSWSWLLSRYCLPSIAPFSLLVPVITMTSSAWWMGEPLQSWKLIAAFLVVTGLCVNLVNSRLDKSSHP